jgi:hypothetical protein
MQGCSNAAGTLLSALDCLWLHGILAGKKKRAIGVCTSANAVPERTIDFGKVTARKKFFTVL